MIAVYIALAGFVVLGTVCVYWFIQARIRAHYFVRMSAHRSVFDASLSAANLARALTQINMPSKIEGGRNA